MRAYIEFDGTVFLSDDDGVLDLPDLTDNLVKKLDLTVKKEMNIGHETVAFCTAARGGSGWPLKDDILFMDNISLRARKAAVMSYPRPVVGGICPREVDGEIKILMVRPKRGIYMGWILPGGFIEYGEEAGVALEREVREELGVSVTEMRIAGTRSLMMPNGYSLLTILYLFDYSGEFSISGEEIEEVSWRPLSDMTMCRQGDMEYMEEVISKWLKR